MGARAKSRKRAVDVLFESDQRGVGLLDVLEARLAHSGSETALPRYTERIVRGVGARWGEINGAIVAAAHEWSIDRMPAVDRAILRVSVWEILAGDEVPVAVAIDQAVTLAGSLSTDDSPGFINGVLGTIARENPRAEKASPTIPGVPVE